MMLAAIAANSIYAFATSDYMLSAHRRASAHPGALANDVAFRSCIFVNCSLGQRVSIFISPV